MSYEKESNAMHVMTSRRSAMLGVLLLGFGGAGMTDACGAPSESACPAADVTPPDTDTTAEACPAQVEKPCMRYRIPLDGNPSTDVGPGRSLARGGQITDDATHDSGRSCCLAQSDVLASLRGA